MPVFLLFQLFYNPDTPRFLSLSFTFYFKEFPSKHFLLRQVCWWLTHLSFSLYESIFIFSSFLKKFLKELCWVWNSYLISSREKGCDTSFWFPGFQMKILLLIKLVVPISNVLFLYGWFEVFPFNFQKLNYDVFRHRFIGVYLVLSLLRFINLC